MEWGIVPTLLHLQEVCRREGVADEGPERGHLGDAPVRLLHLGRQAQADKAHQEQLGLLKMQTHD